MVVSPGSLGQKSPSAEFRAAASPARARGMMGLLSDVVLHLTVDHLAPLEYDGGAHISLPATDPRLSSCHAGARPARCSRTALPTVKTRSSEDEPYYFELRR